MEHVLVVEDSPEIAALMSLTLRMEGYQVSHATNGTHALEMACSKDGSITAPDLILLDVMMPGLTGFQVGERLKSDPATRDIPIIFVTAKHEMTDLIQGLEIAVDYISKPFAVPELLARVRAALRMKKLQAELKASNEQLSRLAVTDGLTGLLNRRGFDSQMEDEVWRARRFGHALGLVIFDLDRFKLVNDTYGHAQGDVVLQEFAQVLQVSSRRVDKVARFGGEEFALLLPATDEVGVNIVCEKVRVATEELRIPLSAGENTNDETKFLQITTSAGGVVISNFVDADLPVPHLAAGMFSLADRCLYAAKAHGRNRVVTQNTTDQELAQLGSISPHSS
jgi:diguanylate cyclase (GGDEF)-like protein